MSFNPNNIQLPGFPLSSLVPIPPLSLSTFQTPSLTSQSPASMLGKREFQNSPYTFNRRIDKKVKGPSQEDLLRSYMTSQSADQPWDQYANNLLEHRKVNLRQNQGFEGALYQTNEGYYPQYSQQSLQFMPSFQQQLESMHNANQVNKWIAEQREQLQLRGKKMRDDLMIPKLEFEEEIVKPKITGTVNIRVDSEKIRSFKEKQKNWNKFKKKTVSSALPVLSEYTKAFPDWDLRTIFDFLHSGKSKEEFDDKLKTKKPRKKRRLKKRLPVRFYNNLQNQDQEELERNT